MKLKPKYLIPAVAAFALLLISCATLLVPKEVVLPLTKLQATLDRKFPFKQRYFEVFDITAANPRLALQAETGRIVATIDAALAPSFMSESWRGTFTLSGMLTIDPVRRAVLMADPRLERIAIDGVEQGADRPIAKVGRLFAERMIKDMPLYTFSPDEFSYAGMRFNPVKIVTRSDALVVTFEPAR
ncbi:MAG: DUF1439 domain-containing protein [Herminiimonas sp.]|nr:DUF1439 domain-containing protein [Herminiimonas sp.]